LRSDSRQRQPVRQARPYKALRVGTQRSGIDPSAARKRDNRNDPIRRFVRWFYHCNRL